ncbi:MAG: hypothetical protein IT373_08365 [Polyangiaceae bacterium]|nr:hypothetical protein [Polyangiaceae bacterium]
MRKEEIVRNSALVATIAVATALLGGGCHAGDCDDQSCGAYGGSASRSFTSCYISGTGSSKDEFWLEDDSGNEFYRCERAASDNDSCGVALIAAKESFCAP